MKPLKSITTFAVVALSAVNASAGLLDIDFNNNVDTWRVVVDGVMGGRSSGRVVSNEPGILRFSGDLSLENNGGFSQVRKNVVGSQFEGAEGIEISVRGDGRTYTFDIRLSNVRMMAGSFQTTFETVAGEWRTIRLPLDEFRLYSFGRRVPNAPALEPTNIESIGFTLADKNPGPFALEVESIRAYGAEAELASTSGRDLSSVAKGAGLNTLLDLVAAAELSLPANEQVTIFAPTDEAFAALPKATVESLLQPEGRETLRAILTYHATLGRQQSSELLSRRSIETLNGQRLAIGMGDGVTIGEASVLATDVAFDGGVVHVIDTVLMPELRPIGELAAATSALSTLTAAVDAAGLGEQLGAENGPFTVFAPVDSAFADLPAGALDDLLRTENRRDLVEVLGLHVVPGRMYSNELLSNARSLTLLGDSIDFSIQEGRLRVGNAGFVATDIEASNGVVHLIDAVLLPQRPDTYSVAASAEALRLCELAIERGVPLFNAGQTGACAAVYEVAIEAMLALGSDDLGRQVTQRLEMGLAEAATERSSTDRAWTYRRAIDDAYEALAAQAQSDSRADEARAAR